MAHVGCQPVTPGSLHGANDRLCRSHCKGVNGHVTIDAHDSKAFLDERGLLNDDAPQRIFVRMLPLVRLVFAELKSDKGKLTAAQAAWLEVLGQVPHVEAYCWRPCDWDEMIRVLSNRLALAKREMSRD
jgi:hypothetical protein